MAGVKPAPEHEEAAEQPEQAEQPSSSKGVAAALPEEKPAEAPAPKDPIELASKDLVYFHRLILSESVESFEGRRSDNGLFHGRGVARMRNGDMYEGDFFEGLMHGTGRYEWSNGTVYEGEWKMCSIQGEGKYIWPDGSWYKGEMKDGMRHGKGVYCNDRPDEDSFAQYEGSFNMGKRHGLGVLYYTADKSSFYEGEWVEGFRHGQGTIVYESGNTYEGAWRNDRKHGHGVMNWATLDQEYVGNWQNDLPNGMGDYTWGLIAGMHDSEVREGPKLTHYQIENRYVGEWREGMRDGEGTFYYATGDIYMGGWVKNAREGFGRIVSENGGVREGQYRSGRLAVDMATSAAGVEEITADDSFEVKEKKRDSILIRPGSKIQTRPSSEQRSIASSSPNTTRTSSFLSSKKTTKDGDLSDSRMRPHVEDLLAGNPKAEEEIDLLMNFLQSRNSTIRCIYRYYSGIPPRDPKSSIMTQHQLWRLLVDCDLRSPSLTFAEVNRMLATTRQSTAIEGEEFDIHCPSQTILVREFVELIVRIAHFMYADDLKTPLIKKVEKILVERLFKKAARFAPQVHSLAITGGNIESKSLLRKIMAIQGRKAKRKTKGEGGGIEVEPGSTQITPSMSRAVSRGVSRAVSQRPSRAGSRGGSAQNSARGKQREDMSVYGGDEDSGASGAASGAGSEEKHVARNTLGITPRNIAKKNTRLRTPRAKNAAVKTGRKTGRDKKAEKNEDKKNIWLAQNKPAASVFGCAELARALGTHELDVHKLYGEKKKSRVGTVIPGDKRKLIDETITWTDVLSILMNEGWIVKDDDKPGLSMRDFFKVALNYRNKAAAAAAALAKPKETKLLSEEKTTPKPKPKPKPNQNQNQIQEQQQPEAKAEVVAATNPIEMEPQPEPSDDKEQTTEVAERESEQKEQEQEQELDEENNNLIHGVPRETAIEIMNSELVLSEFAMALAGFALYFQGNLGGSCEQFTPEELEEAEQLIGDNSKVKAPDAASAKVMAEAKEEGKNRIKKRAENVVRAFMYRFVSGEVADSEEVFPQINDETPLMFT